MDLTPNEWLLEYMVPGSGRETLIMNFLDAFEASGDLLLVRRASPFTQKLYTFSKQHHFDARNLFRRFHKLMRDPKVRIIDESELVQIPSDLKDACPPEDLYLVELAAVGNDKLIITTDSKFLNAVNGKHGFSVRFADDFLADYLASRHVASK